MKINTPRRDASLPPQAQQQMRTAMQTETFVSLTERNWKALLELVQMLLRQGQQTEGTLNTLLKRPDIERYLQTQENLMQEHLDELTTQTEAFANRAGSLNEKFSSTADRLTKNLLEDTRKTLSELQEVYRRQCIRLAVITGGFATLPTVLFALLMILGR